MALTPQAQPTAQMPSFQAGQMGGQQTQAKPEKPVVHGLVNGDEIDQRIAQMPHDAQEYLTKAVMTYPELPTIMGIAIGPEAQAYFKTFAAAVAKQSGSQNSPQGAPADAGGLTQNSAPQGAPTANPATPGAPTS